MLRYVKNTRLQPTDPFIIFDLYGDALQIDRIMSSESCYFELMENGDIHTHNGLITDYRHTISLEQIFTISLPREKAAAQKK